MPRVVDILSRELGISPSRGHQKRSRVGIPLRHHQAHVEEAEMTIKDIYDVVVIGSGSGRVGGCHFCQTERRGGCADH